MVVVTCDRLIYDVDDAPVDKAAIVVVEDRVQWIGPAVEAPSPDGADVVALGSHIVLPGLVDSHAHISTNMAIRGDLAEQHYVDIVTASLRGVANLREDLFCGVTTMRTMGGPDKLEARFRDAIDAGTIEGPRLQIAVRMLRPTHGTANFVGITADGRDELRRVIRETFYFGADWLKIFGTNVMHGETMVDDLRGDLTGVPTYSSDELRFAIDEGHAIGLKVAVHALGGPAIRWAIEAGVDSIEHGDLMDEDDVELFVQHGTYLCSPNLLLMFDPEEIRLSRSYGLPHEAWWVEKTDAAVANLRRLIPRLLEAGVKICLGVDSNHGLLWREAGHLFDLGATPSQALRAVTKNGAELLGLEDQVGSLRPGMVADLVAVDEDPLVNPWALGRARLVMKSGHLVTAGEG